ncbi:MAG: hypothetical protein AAFW87_00430 [Pseudomonadota bacterium]
MNPRWLFRMARWAQSPPSERRVKFIFAIIAVCLVVFGVEYFFGLPDWMRVDPKAGRWRP